MSTGRVMQPKALLKIPKEMPSNIIIKSENKDRREQSQGALNRPKLDLSKLELARLPQFKDLEHEKWRKLYLAKLKGCYRLADFSETKNDLDFKEQKKDALIELIDILDDPAAPQYLLNDLVLREAIKLIEANLFRTFSNKTNKKTTAVDPDEDEPHLEEAWPHLQLAYELLLKFMMSTFIPAATISGNISNSFVKQMVDLFDSEDPRERDYLKTILHRIYGKFMPLRTTIRTQVMNCLLKVTYEQENHNGLTELLEILSSIISGFNTPLKPDHSQFFLKVMVPLHKVKQLSNFNSQLQQCIKNYLEKDNSLSIPLIKGLLEMWPITNPAKEVVFLNEIEEILEQYPSVAQAKFSEYGPQLLKRTIKCAQSMHYQAAERSLLLLNSDTIQKLVKINKNIAYPLVVKNLITGSQQTHWNQTVTTITYEVIRSYMEIEPDLFEKLTSQAQVEEKARAARQKDVENKWLKLEQKYGK